MNITIYQVDAFTSTLFGGNPAAVCPLEGWLSDELLQAIASENNLSETAFFVRGEAGYQLRWFTPEYEIDLCGHATLATAFVIFEFLDVDAGRVSFTTKSGELIVDRDRNGLLSMNFPARPGMLIDCPAHLASGLKDTPLEVYKSRDYMAVFEHEEIIKRLAPDFAILSQLDGLGVVVTAPGKEADFVSRAFFPKEGIPEDPVTGSTHCTLIPYWSKRLGKPKLRALQLSRRGGELFCEERGERVLIAGKAVLYLRGEIFV